MEWKPVTAAFRAAIHTPVTPSRNGGSKSRKATDHRKAVKKHKAAMRRAGKR